MAVICAPAYRRQLSLRRQRQLLYTLSNYAGRSTIIVCQATIAFSTTQTRSVGVIIVIVVVMLVVCAMPLMCRHHAI